MHVLWTWVVAIVLLFTTTVGWLVSIPIVVGVARGLNNTLPASGSGRSIATMIELLSFVWGPLFDIFILGWAVISSQRRDVESEVYG